MTDTNIVYRNIFLMLAYAIDELEIDKNYVDKLEINSVIDVYIELLDILLKRLVTMGIHCEYTKHDIITDKVKGKLNIGRTITSGGVGRNKYTCTINKTTTKTVYNSIIFYTLDKFMRATKISSYTLYFQNHYELDIDDMLDINMEMAPYYYRPVLKICQILIKNESYSDLINREYYDYSLSYNQLRMYIIFEKFVRNLIARNFKDCRVGRVNLNVESVHLRGMITDCTIEKDDKTLIIDTKYYTTLGKNSKSFNSSIRHQIRDYVYTYNENCGSNKANGLVLFAKTTKINSETREYIENTYEKIGKNGRGHIRYKLVDLEEDFDTLKNSIVNIVKLAI